MKCFKCETELILGEDHDCEESDEYNIVTNLSCPNCEAFILVYWDKKENRPPLKKNISKGGFYDDFNYVYYH